MTAPRTKADFYVCQTLAKSHLREAHGQELFPAREVSHLVVAFVAGDTAPELFGMDPLQDLIENCLAEMHPDILGKKNPKENEREKRPPSSNRSHLIFDVSILI